MPDLRIVDDALWHRVHERQSRTAVKHANAHSWDRRRPRTLFSGLMVCGTFGSGFSKVGQNRFGSSVARNKGSAICATIRQDDLEARVLLAQYEHLMDPVREFCGAYAAERNRFQAERQVGRSQREAELDRVKRDHAKLVDAIGAGIPPERARERMMALDARRQELEAELGATPEAEPVREHPRMAAVYREKVRALVVGLSDPEQALEVAEANRSLGERIVLTLSEAAPLVPVVDLEGVLAGLLALATGADPNPSAPTQKPASPGRWACNQSWLRRPALVTTGCS